MHVGRSGFRITGFARFTITRLRGATCEAFGTRLARLVDNFEVSYGIYIFPHAFYFPQIRSSSWKAFEGDSLTGWYDDPGTSESESSHGDIKSIVEEVAQDMGFCEGELDNKLEVIEALLGDDGRQLLESDAESGKTLRKIIEDELEEEDYRP